MNDIQKPEFTVAEYFAGIGLVRMGLEPCGWQVLYANDISEKKYAMYLTFFSDAKDHYVVKNIFDLDVETIPPTILATCSFPCVDLSLAGNMNGIEGKHSSAFWGFIKILKSQKENAPPMLLIENVPGWLFSNKGNDFRVTIQALNQLGYACDVFTLDALRFTPQSRPRVFLIGAKIAPSSASFDCILDRPVSLLSPKLKTSIKRNWDLRWFFNKIPQPPPLQSSGLAKIVESVSDRDHQWWTEAEVERHLEMMNTLHQDRVAKLMHNNQVSYRTFFRRIREGKQRVEVRDDDLAGCLRTAVGGSGKQFLIQAGKGTIKMRTMTPREYARLQTIQ